MHFFKNKRNIQINQIREILLALEDCLETAEIMLYIKNNVEALITDENAKFSIDSNSFTIKTPYVEFDVRVDSTFSSFSSLETTERIPQPLGFNTTKKIITIKDDFKTTSSIYINEQQEEIAQTVREHSEHRTYLKDNLIYRRSKKSTRIIESSKYHSSSHISDYFISGEEAIKRQKTYEISGHFSKNDPTEEISNIDIQYFRIPSLDSRCFATPFCLLEQRGRKIDVIEFKNKLKKYRNTLAKENAPKELLKHME